MGDMHLIIEVNFYDQSWGFNLNGLKYFLTNASRYVDIIIRHKWKQPWGNENERFILIGDGNLLKDDKISSHFIIQKIGSNNIYVMQVDDFRNQLEIDNNC
jgi:hypothetical protein